MQMVIKRPPKSQPVFRALLVAFAVGVLPGLLRQFTPNRRHIFEVVLIISALIVQFFLDRSFRDRM